VFLPVGRLASWRLIYRAHARRVLASVA